MEFIFPAGKITRSGAVIQGKTAALIEIMTQVNGAGMPMGKSADNRFILCNGVTGFPYKLCRAPANGAVSKFHLCVEQKERSRQRCQHNEHQPCKFRGGIHITVEQIENHNGVKEQLRSGKMGQIVPQPAIHGNNHQNLQQHQKRNHQKPAEH